MVTHAILSPFGIHLSLCSCLCPSCACGGCYNNVHLCFYLQFPFGTKCLVWEQTTLLLVIEQVPFCVELIIQLIYHFYIELFSLSSRFAALL